MLLNPFANLFQTLYLDIDPSLGLKRVKSESKNRSANGLDRIESEGIFFHEKIREGFHLLVKREKERFFIIDAMLSKEQVLQESLELIYKKLGSLNK
jgi:dTMP kinase